MDFKRFMQRYWHLVAGQHQDGLRACFHPDACVYWHCTNEQFTREEFIRVNCEYPGRWKSEIERMEHRGTLIITVTRVWSESCSFHAVSFFEINDGFIRRLDEYWGDDGDAPAWRRALQIGKPIE